MEFDKIVVVKKNTPLEDMLRRHSTVRQVQFFLESRGASYEEYKAAHDDYRSGMQEVVRSLPATVRSQVLDKEGLGSYQFGEQDLVVVVGDPGLLVNVAKYVNGQPTISVNPDPSRFDSVLSTCLNGEFAKCLEVVLSGEPELEKLTMAEAKLNDGQVLYALNDFYIGRKTHVSARYEIRQKGTSERQSSSGIIVSTGTGSTGWMTSVFRGAEQLTGARNGRFQVPFDRDSSYLMYAVREPFPSPTTGTSMVHGMIGPRDPLVIRSHMPEQGVIFSDGVERDYLDFTAGKEVTIRPAEQKVHLVRNDTHK